MSKRQSTSPFAVRAQARETRARLERDTNLREVEKMFAYLMRILRKHLTITVGGKRIKVKLDKSAVDWWWLHYKTLFYFARVAKGLDWNTRKSRKGLEERAKALASVASFLAMDNLGDKTPYKPTIDDDVAAWASKKADCPPEGAVRPFADFCN